MIISRTIKAEQTQHEFMDLIIILFCFGIYKLIGYIWGVKFSDHALALLFGSIVGILIINGKIYWAMHEKGPDLFDFLDIGSFIGSFIAEGMCYAIDEKLGIQFFSPIAYWFCNGITYFIFYIFCSSFLGDIISMNDDNECWPAICLNGFSIVFFICFYYFHIPDLGIFSMPEHSAEIESYFWVGVGFSILIFIKRVIDKVHHSR